MSRQRSRTAPIFLSLLISLPATLAAVSMQSVQRVVGFTPPCIAAYNTNLPSCDVNMFRGIGATGQCSQQCFDELTKLTSDIQDQCNGQQASGDTVIGHFFQGDANRFLCGFEAGDTGSTTAAAAASSETTTTAVAATSTSTSATETTSTSTARAESTSSSDEGASTNESDSTTLTTTTSTTPTDSTSSSSESSTSTSSIATAGAGTGNDQIGITGGGSPFDIQVPASDASAVRTGWAVLAALLLGSLVFGR